ncbi:TIGR00341 family protein [Halorussus salilacus]|uniref:TIGR00341 family protein n=1 Tax=Halorussus salilacus TaxID=2953750 RepID=UPI00209F0D21|nr:TIGR00341 family protein [Halorussus salilacus]USZ69458.1 TIGR00341 family protein [Halorussus salilacus]
MRLVQVSIPAGKRDTVIGVLDEEGIDYMLTDETSGREYTDIAYFPLPNNAVQPILDRLQDAGLGDEVHAVIIDAKTDTSRRFEKLERKYAEGNGDPDRISRQEIRSTASALSPEFPTFVAMTIISAVVATAGLLLDSPAVVVGSMVIAPLIGPAVGASVGTVLGDRELFRDGLRFQVLGGTLTIASATVFAVAVRFGFLVPPGTDVTTIPQISGRLTPDFLSLVVALGAGAAGVLSVASGVSVALVGVMIAAALVPPAAAVGISIAWGHPMAAISSGVLVLVNLLSINLSGLVVLWYLGYRPNEWFQLDETRANLLKRAGVLLAALAILSVFLGGVTFTSMQSASFQEDARDEVKQVVVDTPGAQLLGVEFQTTDDPTFSRSSRVVVTVGRPSGEEYPDLAERLSRRINAHADNRVAVQVRFVDTETVPA